MRLEDRNRYEVKGMPEDMRKMVEREVEKQMKTKKIQFKTKKVAIAVVAATMAIGTIAVAGNQIYRMTVLPQGKYSVVSKIGQTEADRPSEDKATTRKKVEYEIPNVKLVLNYIPEGMEDIQGNYSYKETPSQGGISPIVYKMDLGDDAFEVLDLDVLESENITAGKHEGVLLKVTTPDIKGVWFDKRVYIYCPEVHHVVELYLGEDVTKEEALKIAAGVELKVMDNEKEADRTWAWSDYIAPKDVAPEDTMAKINTVQKSRIKKMFDVGETMKIKSYADDGMCEIDIKVSDIQIYDDVNLLNVEYSDADLRDEVDENGKLLQNKINYIKYGDGVNTIDETVDFTMSNQKLIYVTVEYTNNTGKDIKELLYYGDLLKLVDKGKEYEILQKESSDGSWDEAVNTSRLICNEMRYYDVRGGERNNNYLSVKNGETKVVHMGFFVNEEELPYTYLVFGNSGSSNRFSGAVANGLYKVEK